MTEDASMLVLFTDIRGFTQWAEANEVFINLNHFIDGFRLILEKQFPPPDYAIQLRGDGALMLSRLPDTLGDRDTARLLSRVLTQITRTDREFTTLCSAFARRVGHATDLRLGWGVVRGKVIRMNDDWTGGNISKCSRYCDEARPFGIIIDQDDFPELPGSAKGFASQVRQVRGIGEVRVWVSAQIATQFVTREFLRETPEVHIAGTCIHEDRPGHFRLLVARRSKERRLFPNKLEGCGGQLRFSESFSDGVRRHYRNEFGIDVSVLTDFHRFYEIREPNEPLIPGIRFLCKQVDTKKPRSNNHSEIFWVLEEDFQEMNSDDFVGDLKHEVIALLGEYKDAQRKLAE